MAVIARAVVEDKQAGLGSPGIDELRWQKPVYPGDTLTVTGTVVDKTPSRSKPEIGSVRTQTIVTNQDHVPVMLTLRTSVANARTGTKANVRERRRRRESCTADSGANLHCQGRNWSARERFRHQRLLLAFAALQCRPQHHRAGI